MHAMNTWIKASSDIKLELKYELLFTDEIYYQCSTPRYGECGHFPNHDSSFGMRVNCNMPTRYLTDFPSRAIACT